MFNPQLVVLFEEEDEMAIEKLSKRPIDPATGTFYGSDSGEAKRNTVVSEDHKAMVSQMIGEHRNFVGIATEEYEFNIKGLVVEPTAPYST